MDGNVSHLVNQSVHHFDHNNYWMDFNDIFLQTFIVSRGGTQLSVQYIILMSNSFQLNWVFSVNQEILVC